MKIVHFDKKQIKGISIRTNNTNEVQPETAKIGNLWQIFYDSVFSHLKNNDTVFSVYYDYESDANGDYSVLIGSEYLDVQAVDNIKQVSIQSSKYLVFSAQGEMPQVVIETWSQVWDYFSNADTDHQRAYTTDFELYKSPTEIEIYIAIR